MIVLVLSACPPGLRGHLTRWLAEVSAGVFVGTVSARVRDLLWDKTVLMIGRGRALLVYSQRNEQGLAYRVHGHHWTPTDIDGVTLMLRPNPGSSKPHDPPPAGWSNAARYRRHSR